MRDSEPRRQRFDQRARVARRSRICRARDARSPPAALATPLTKGSQPMKPTSGLRAAWATRCSPPPKPISSQIRAGSKANSGAARSEGRRVDFERRQPLGDQAGVMGAQALALAAPVERPARRRVAGRFASRAPTRPANEAASARSVFSQEKPPSAVRRAAEMAVGRGARVDRLVELEVLANAARRQVHDLHQRALELAPRRRGRCRAGRRRSTAAWRRRSHRRAAACSGRRSPAATTFLAR